MTPWMIDGGAQPDAGLRLFCFPFAGGGASAYHRWLRIAPPGIQVCAVEYAGRGMRIREEPYLRLVPLVRDLADRMTPYLDRPFAFFGHSMGGLVAYELTRLLLERGADLPRHLFISATAAPGQPPTRRSLLTASDAEVLEELRDLGGTPRQLLDDRELMAMAVRTLRADYSVLGTYEFRRSAPLDVPITVFGGSADEVTPPARLRGWREHTAAGCRVRLFPGGHFFLHAVAEDLLATVADELAPVASVPA